MHRSVCVAQLLCSGCVERLIVEGDADGGFGSGDDQGQPEDDADDCVDADDCDGDGVPDADDPVPDDPGGPGPVEVSRMYFNTPEALFRFDPATNTLERIGPFVLDDGSAASVTDIAIDRFGLLYAVSTGTLYVCDPVTVVCTPLGSEAADSAGFTPFGVLESDDDTLVVVAQSEVRRIDVVDGRAEPTVLFDVAPFSSSGDVTAFGDTQMLLSSPDPGGGGDVLVPFDVVTGELFPPIALTPANTYGLTTYEEVVWAVTDFGEILRLGPTGLESVGRTQNRFWGAATHPDAR